MEVIEVFTGHSSVEKVLPKSFIWCDKQYMVESIGRRWQDEKGEHLLVMVGLNQRVFELLFDSKSEQWWLARRFDNSAAV